MNLREMVERNLNQVQAFNSDRRPEWSSYYEGQIVALRRVLKWIDEMERSVDEKEDVPP